MKTDAEPRPTAVSKMMVRSVTVGDAVQAIGSASNRDKISTGGSGVMCIHFLEKSGPQINGARINAARVGLFSKIERLEKAIHYSGGNYIEPGSALRITAFGR